MAIQLAKGEITTIEETEAINVGVNVGVNTDTNVGVKEYIIEHIKAKPTISAKELSVLLQKTPRTIERHLKDLREQGVLTRGGSDKTGYWKINI
jgi:predicted HTH transcriptional regulator